jgi:predicted ATP-dependent protease
MAAEDDLPVHDPALSRIPEPLLPARLRRRTDPSDLGFETTADLKDIREILGQDRALDAVRFGLAIGRPGFNLFLLGPLGVGKRTLASRIISEVAACRPVADDWVYTHNFADPRRPRALRLPSGRGTCLRDDAARLIEDLRIAIPGAFESDDYRTRRQMLESELKEKQEQSFGLVEDEARTHGIGLLRTPVGFAFAPMRDGKVVPPAAFETWPEDERKRVEDTIEHLQASLRAAVEEVQRRQKTARDALRDLNRQTSSFAAGHLIVAVKKAYVDLPDVQAFLDSIEHEIADDTESFLPEEPEPAIPHFLRRNVEERLRLYRVNLLVHHENGGGAPVVFEEHPTHDNLIGKIEHRAEMGALTTDFTLIKGGALHRANGGYLVLDARKLLTEPFAWDALKRVVKAGQIRIESPGERFGLVSTIGLDPGPIPLDAKIVLLGDRSLYYLLSDLDPEFGELFKVAAEFDDEMARNPDHVTRYAHLIATLARRNALRPLDRQAAARVIDHAARLAGDSEKLTTDIARIGDFLAEADHWAAEAGRAVIAEADVAHALAARDYRLGRLRERTLEEIVRGTLMIDTAGGVVGQINGLAVYMIGGSVFGRPTRITARVRPGSAGIVDIERSVRLGGPMHSKGVMILTGFLTGCFAIDRPLSLSASLVFEQSYGGIDGDSASSAELYALLSAISGIAIDQGFAVTGSVNQRGQVQAIGGANEKIEGFFDICAARGLTGKQGVLIPAANVVHLMLADRVVEAVTAGQFQILPIESIDQGIAILTGTPAGVRGADGRFPPHSVNGRVEARLIELAESRRTYEGPVAMQGAPGRHDDAGLPKSPPKSPPTPPSVPPDPRSIPP